MRALRSLLLLISSLIFAGPVLADSPKPTVEAEKPFTVEVIKDIAYNDAKDADPEKHKLDLYLPKGAKDFPVLFFVHGGTWQSGDRKIYGKFGEEFAGQGIGCVIISYRLSPKVQHPAHIEDVAKAFAWACDNIGKRGGSADKIFICGHSAGGHLVSLLATDESYLKAEKHSIKDIKGVISISGVYTIPPIGLAKVFGTDNEVLKKASPLYQVTPKRPPFCIIYADRDLPLLDLNAEQMCKKLKECDSEVESLKVEKRDHITIMIELATHLDDPAHKTIVEFINKHTEKK
jgi:acetyl esterase/lipase